MLSRVTCATSLDLVFLSVGATVNSCEVMGGEAATVQVPAVKAFLACPVTIDLCPPHLSSSEDWEMLLTEGK